ncbi:TetR/AcrR family transcriptional regulator [Saccharibacillus sacchari]|uniref:TetR/AcrR family transcriptional regulator n=1 Tax=Saccharibacillus sacchari TaxID=456493 RepID=A0ACC6PFS2_9BACL
MNNQTNKPDKKQEARERLIPKLLPHLRKNGLQSVRMDEIAKAMEVSRATLYKYFSTKEEIVGFVIGGFATYMEDLIVNPTHSEKRIGSQFQQIFEQSISLIVYFSDAFLKDLEAGYPEWYDRFEVATKQREANILAFYDEGIRNGIFHDLNGKLLIAQDELLRSVLNPKYLMTNQLTVGQILSDYYELKKIQLFKPESLILIDDSVMPAKIDYLEQKVMKNLF